MLAADVRPFKQRDDGFTLLEMLVVVAILAILISVAIPIFTRTLEQSREVADVANVRVACASLVMAYSNNDATAQYNGRTIKQANGVYKAVVSPLAQGIDGWSSDVSALSVGGVPASEWVGEPRAGGQCTVTLYPAAGKMVLYWSTRFATMTLAELKAVDNDVRVAEDQNTLRQLGNAILAKGWSIADLKQNLGLPETSGGAVRIADYYQLKSGSFDSSYESAGFRLTSKPGGDLEQLLSQAGYDGGGVQSTSTDADGKRTNTTYANSLFYSDELASNQFGSYDIGATKRSIIISDIKTSDNRIVGFTIYTKAMDDQANLNAQEKAKFSLKIS